MQLLTHLTVVGDVSREQFEGMEHCPIFPGYSLSNFLSESDLQCKKSDLIMKTCLYNFDPLEPHFYIVKLGFTGVYIIFVALACSRV